MAAPALAATKAAADTQTQAPAKGKAQKSAKKVAKQNKAAPSASKTN